MRALLAIALSCGLTAVSVGQIPSDDPSEGLNAWDFSQEIAADRPMPADGGATTVRVGLFIIDISKLDDVHQSFTADIAVRLLWHDPRLADPDAEHPVRKIAPEAAWTPHIGALNARRIWPSFPAVLYVDRAGNVMQRQRYFGQFSMHLDLRDFPFDTNAIRIHLVAPDYNPEQMQLVLDGPSSGRSPRFSLVDAAIGEGEERVEAFYFAPADTHMPALVYDFEVTRHHSYYLWKVILPLAIIVMMSWLVFWLDPSQAGPAIGLSATAVLTLIAYRFLLGSLVPKVSYLTRLDVFIVGATVLVFLGMVVAVTAADFAAMDKHDKGVRFNKIARVAFPFAFVVLVYMSFFAGR